MHGCHALLLRLVLVLLFVLPVAVEAQTLVVYNVDASGFPTIRANVAVLDAARTRITNITAADLAILENGDDVTDVTVSCPQPSPPEPFNAVLVNDRSGSMTLPIPGGMTRMDLAKLGSSEFVSATNFGSGSSVAITSFESTAAIVSDFQTSAAPLLAAIGTIVPEGGTLYDPPFLDPIAGAIGMLSSRPSGVRRVIVFLTDGQPNEPAQVARIISAARAAGVEVYAVTLGMPMSGELHMISAMTGGSAFGNVNSVEEMRGVYQQIAIAAGGSEPCVVTWKSRTGCGERSRNRSVSITHLPTSAQGRTTYYAPASSVGGLVVMPSTVSFGVAGPPTVIDTQIVISAGFDSLRIARADVVPEGAFSIIDWGGAPPPFVEPPGSTRTITIRFAPADTQKYVGSLVLYGPPCPPYPVTLTGGGGREDGSALTLITPVGGEAFSGCDSVLIRWGGVAPTVPVTIEASSDDGVTWREVARNVRGLGYRWMPPHPGREWRIRITAQTSEERHVITTTAGGGESLADDIGALSAALLSPTGVAVRGDSMFIAESGMHRIRRVDLTTGRISTIAGTGNPGSNGEVIATLARLNNPSHVLIVSNYLFFADRGNHRVRRINQTDGRIFTIAGTGESGFDGDGGQAAAARLQFPSYLAINGRYLYISDAGNQRIRSIDLSSNVITTIAGGGTATGDGGAGFLARLQDPAGIAVNDRFLYIAETGAKRIRRIDLRTGVITTVAGTGFHGSTGDGGPASVATFMSPVGVELVRDILYVTDSAAHRVRRIDLLTGTITTIAGTGAPGYSGDGGEAELARLFEPGQPSADAGYLYVPDVRNGRIRAISIDAGPGSDSSRSPFTVSVAALSVRVPANRQLDIGQMALRQARDTSIAGALCNTGDIPLVVDSARIVGTHASDFSIVSGAPSVEIAPGDCAPLEIRFRPSARGPRTAMAILYGRCANADTLWLSGTGVDTCGVTSLELADVGTVVLGAGARDTVITQAICNTSTTTIVGDARLVAGTHAFSIMSGGGRFTLAPGACHTVEIRFAPGADGRVTGEIDYGIPQYCGSARTRLLGRATSSPELSAPDLVGFGSLLCPTDRDTSIVVRSVGAAPLVITSAAIVDDNEGFTLLPPIPTAAAPLTIAPGESASLAIRFAPASTGAKTAALELTTNAAGSPHRIALDGRRELVRASIAAIVVFPAGIATVPHDTLVTVRNDGTVPLELTGASLSGADAASYEVPSDQFPLTIAPSSSALVRVRLLALATTDDPLRAGLSLAYGPSCDSGRIATTLMTAGTPPVLDAGQARFRPIVCADETASDTTLFLMNLGSLPLDITGASIVGDAAGAFTFEHTYPITIEGGEDTLLALRFAPPGPGEYTAELHLANTTRDGTAIVPLLARREAVSLASTPQRVEVTASEAGLLLEGTLVLTNASTVPLDLALATTSGVFTIIDPTTRSLAAGGSTTVAVRIVPTRGGRHYDTLVVTEPLCGTTLRIPLEAVVALPAVADIALPHVTARPDERIALPVRITIIDRPRFEASGARRYTASVTMYGTVFVPDSVAGARLVSHDYDMATRRQTVVFTGEYDGGDVLASIHGRTLLGDTLGTPLTFASFTWDSTSVGATLSDGTLTIVGSCLDVGLRLVAAPKILKVSPLPARERATIELELEEWVGLRVALYDARGLPVRVLAEITLDAGRSALELDMSDVPSGAYTLAVETPYARSVVGVVVAR